MRVLLDTHTLLWWVSNHSSLSAKANAVLAELSNEVFVSAASAWEIVTKARLGKLEAGSLAQNFSGELDRQGFQPLAITVEHGQRAGALPGPHRDPFDRMLIAQAQAENLIVLSNERIFDSYGVQRLW